VVDRTEKPAERRFVDTTNVQLDYRYGAVGPSGIGKVEIYATADRGTSWVKLGDDADRKSPAHVQLPGEGLFGIRLVITNGNGFGGTAPRTGDRPQFYVEVDTSAPTVVWQQHDIGAKLGAIDIRWTASDANLTSAPVSLFYRTRLDSNWQTIAQNVKNDGVYRWSLPSDLGAQIHLKLEVTDLAGNTAKLESPTPIVLDRTELRATLVDATPRDPNQANDAEPVTIPPAPAPTPTLPTGVPQTSISLPIPASLPTLPQVPPLRVR